MLRKRILGSNEKAPAGKRKRERKVKEKAFPWSKNQKNLIGTRKNMLINLYMIKESEKPYCTVKEKLSRGLIVVCACYERFDIIRDTQYNCHFGIKATTIHMSKSCIGAHYLKFQEDAF